MTKIIVSYDGTENDDDALALARVLGAAGASLGLAYVRHAKEAEGGREAAAQTDAEALLRHGAIWLERPEIPQHVIVNASTPNGLAELAAIEHADVVLFGSEYRTATNHVQPQASAQRMLENGPFAIGIAPAGLRLKEYSVSAIAAINEVGDTSPVETAEALAGKLGASIVARASAGADLLILGSTPGTSPGRVAISASTAYVIETSNCAVLVVPRGTVLRFGGE
ncbi:MAG TPA: universal stress protein [Gaiellaceae bacterium]|nr:universal stress protein [Gaiellaceae bacterium]